MLTRRFAMAAPVGLALLSPTVASAADYWPGVDGWETQDPAAAGFDPKRLSDAVGTGLNEHSTDVLVTRKGRLVAERYAPGQDAHSTLQIASAAKSMVSVLVGIAIDQGKIKSVDQSAADFIPQWRGTPKAAITVRHLLTMTSGLDDTGLAVRGVTGDQFLINAAAPQRAAPGTRWAYQTAIFHLLYHVVAHAVGEPFEAFAERNLLGPLGMRDTTWLVNKGQGANGLVTNYYTANCSGRDLMRFGLFALRGGQWAGRQLVSAAYLKQATSPSQTLNPAYGFLWWENAEPGAAAEGAERGRAPSLRFPGSPRDTFAALGAGGQVVLVVPSLEIVVVRQGQPPGARALPDLLASVCAAVQKT